MGSYNPRTWYICTSRWQADEAKETLQVHSMLYFLSPVHDTVAMLIYIWVLLNYALGKSYHLLPAEMKYTLVRPA
jgi:hypothetical protein